MKHLKLVSKIILAASMLFAYSFSYTQTITYSRIYRVTTNTLNNDAPVAADLVNGVPAFTSSLNMAMSSALLYMQQNPYSTVGILFDVSVNPTDPEASLVRITETLPTFENTTGRIVFDIFDEENQGVLCCDPLDYGFDIRCDVIIRNLIFKCSDTQNGIHLKISDSNSIIVAKNIFINGNKQVFLVYPRNFEFKENEFISFTYKAIESIENINSSTHGKIEKNIFESSGADKTAIEITYSNSESTYNIRENDITCDQAIFFPTEYGAALSSLKIVNNNLISRICIFIGLFISDIDINGNTLTYSECGIHFAGALAPLNFSGYNEIPSLINDNSLGYNTENNSNSFILSEAPNTSHYSIIYDEGNQSLEPIRIIGQNLPSPIKVGYCSNAQIRDSKIDINSSLISKPISLLNNSSSNGNISSPVVKRLTYGDDDEILVKYEMPGLINTNANFDVDFYASNIDGDLLQHTNTQQFTSVSAFYETTIMNDYDIYSMTVTSSGTGPNFTNGLGTSEATLIYPGYEVTYPQTVCKNDPVEITVSPIWASSTFEISLNGGGTYFTGTSPYSFSISSEGVFTFCVRQNSSSVEQCYEINVEDCVEIGLECENCIGTFAPEPGAKYLVSAWVKEDNSPTANTYEDAVIKVYYYNQYLSDLSGVNPISQTELVASGSIIDGWQKIEDVIEIPFNARTLSIELVNNSDNDVFFDDVRFQPFNSTLQTYVYDLTTGELNAVLDENNYATFYEYDEEGRLVRIKKETERGVMTIQESRTELQK